MGINNMPGIFFSLCNSVENKQQQKFIVYLIFRHIDICACVHEKKKIKKKKIEGQMSKIIPKNLFLRL